MHLCVCVETDLSSVDLERLEAIRGLVFFKQNKESVFSCEVDL